MVLERLTVQSSLALLDSAFAHQGNGEGAASKNTILEDLVVGASKKAHDFSPSNGTDRDGALVSTSITLNYPLIALGASAACHYPAIAKAMGAELIVPEDADVAGAVGAAAGSIRQRSSITVTMPTDGVYRVHLIKGPMDFNNMDAALHHAEECAKDDARQKAEAAGARGIVIASDRKVKIVNLSAEKTLFIEATIHGIATGTQR